MPYVDQAAALIVLSVGEARRLGISPSRWVFLHGCADGCDTCFVSERAELHASPAIRWGARRALEMADKRIEDLQYFDLYRCFPSAVEIACREIGLTEDDPRGLTVTGGLPFFGGPGNNYATHSIAQMICTLRDLPGSFGLVMANGNYVTKHSLGVYSTSPVEGPWRRESPSVLQPQLDALPKAPLIERAEGPATIETYTVMHDKSGAQYFALLGRLEQTGERFVANTPSDSATLADLQSRDGLNRPGMVQQHGGVNLFVPQG